MEEQQQHYCLKWNNHQSNNVAVFSTFLYNEMLVDVTLFADGAEINAHKLILAACSPYFQRIFLKNPCQHPIIILKDVESEHLRIVIDFVYHGEVNCTHTQLPEVLRVADMLKVKGLTEVSLQRRGEQLLLAKQEESDEQKAGESIRPGPKEQQKTATFQAAAMFSQHEHCGKSHDIVALKSIAPKSEIGADAEEQENSNDSVEAQPESPDGPDNEEEEEDEQEDEPENELEHANNHENEVEHEDEQEQELNHGPANENEQEYDYSTVIAETPQLTVTTNTGASINANQIEEYMETNETHEPNMDEECNQSYDCSASEDGRAITLDTSSSSGSDNSELENSMVRMVDPHQHQHQHQHIDETAQNGFPEQTCRKSSPLHDEEMQPTVTLNYIETNLLAQTDPHSVPVPHVDFVLPEVYLTGKVEEPIDRPPITLKITRTRKPTAYASSVQKVVKEKRGREKFKGPEWEQAIEAVRKGMGFCRAARAFGINNRTLWLEYQRRGFCSDRARVKELNSVPTPR